LFITRYPALQLVGSDVRAGFERERRLPAKEKNDLAATLAFRAPAKVAHSITHLAVLMERVATMTKGSGHNMGLFLGIHLS
jgi:hypothetical protein